MRNKPQEVRIIFRMLVLLILTLPVWVLPFAVRFVLTVSELCLDYLHREVKRLDSLVLLYQNKVGLGRLGNWIKSVTGWTDYMTKLQAHEYNEALIRKRGQAGVSKEW